MIRIAVLVIIAIGVAAFLRLHSKSMSEDQVRGILVSRELVGMPVAKAALRLQHEIVPIVDGDLACDFAQVPGWTAGSVILVVKNGDVTDAYFEREAPKGH